ncbi:MAG: hypothetical protein KF775_19745 [Cyclobacteriaceae bacterium]|nr:hypothetical protein [Cyclobacteriaceae bacterium]
MVRLAPLYLGMGADGRSIYALPSEISKAGGAEAIVNLRGGLNEESGYSERQLYKLLKQYNYGIPETGMTFTRWLQVRNNRLQIQQQQQTQEVLITGEWKLEPTASISSIEEGDERFKIRGNPGGKIGVGFIEKDFHVTGTIKAKVLAKKIMNGKVVDQKILSYQLDITKTIVVGFGLTWRPIGYWFAADTIMTGIGLTGWGAPIAGVYFLGRFAYGIYDMATKDGN